MKTRIGKLLEELSLLDEKVDDFEINGLKHSLKAKNIQSHIGHQKNYATEEKELHVRVAGADEDIAKPIIQRHLGLDRNGRTKNGTKVRIINATNNLYRDDSKKMD